MRSKTKHNNLYKIVIILSVMASLANPGYVEADYLRAYLNTKPSHPDVAAGEFALKWAAAASSMEIVGGRDTSTVYPMILPQESASAYGKLVVIPPPTRQWNTTIKAVLGVSGEVKDRMGFESFNAVLNVAKKRGYLSKKLEARSSYEKWLRGIVAINAQRALLNFDQREKLLCFWPFGCVKSPPCPEKN